MMRAPFPSRLCLDGPKSDYVQLQTGCLVRVTPTSWWHRVAYQLLIIVAGNMIGSFVGGNPFKGPRGVLFRTLFIAFLEMFLDKFGIKKNNRQASFVSGGLALIKPTQDEGYSLEGIHFSIIVQI